MRWLFLFVLLINIAYVAWELNQPPKQERARKSSNSGVPELVLVNEVLSQDIKTAATKVYNAPKVDVVSAGQAAPEKTVTEEARSKVSELPVLKVAKVKPDSCYTLGPYRDLEKLRGTIRAIKKYVAEVEFRSREETEQSIFWVYLPPQKSTRSVQELSKLLISKKIRDYYVITSGPKTNGMSMGHFKEKDRAVSHAKQLKQKGFKAEIEAIFKTYVIYWLDYRVKNDNQMPEGLIDQQLRPNMSVLDRQCS